MNWSKAILLLYLGFASLILTLVFICFGHRSELEFKDYYSRELHFQDQINSEKNANELQTPIRYEVTGRSVEIVYPSDLLAGISGTVHLLRPSDSSMDVYRSIATDGAGRQLIEDKKLEKGFYRMRIEVLSRGRSYFKEASIELK